MAHVRDKLDLGFIKKVLAGRVPDCKYTDGRGLILEVKNGSRAKCWVLPYRSPITRKEHHMGLGSLDDMGLEEAREWREFYRKQIRQGIDPLAAKREAKVDRQLEAAKDATFREVFDEWFDFKARRWSASTARQCRWKMEKHVLPKIGNYHIKRFSTQDKTSSARQVIADLLQPMWYTTPIAANQILGHIKGVLDRALSKNYIWGDNAADIKGPLQHLLTPLQDHHESEHQPKVDFKKIGKFMAELRAHYTHPAIAPIEGECGCLICGGPHVEEIKAARLKGASSENLIRRFGGSNTAMGEHVRYIGAPANRPLSAYALELIILTGVRKEMVTSARWNEIEWATRRWKCSQHKTRGKTKRDYVVALNTQAIAVLKEMQEWQKANGIVSEYIFQDGPDAGPMSNQSPASFLRRVFNFDGRWRDSSSGKKVTVHGFRRTLGDWAESFPYDQGLVKMALNHVSGSQLHRTYTLGFDRFNPYLCMMEEWGKYCDRTEPPAVIQLSERRKQQQEIAKRYERYTITSNDSGRCNLVEPRPQLCLRTN
jgi:integrase